MSSTETMKRPFTVTLVMFFIGLSAILNLVFGTLLMFAIFGENPTFTDPLGNQHTISGAWLFFNGAITFILGLMYLWLIRMSAIGSATAQVIIQMLAVINLVFAIFNLPYGWYTILLSSIVLILVSNHKATLWFRQTQ